MSHQAFILVIKLKIQYLKRLEDLDWSLSPFEDSASYTWPTWTANLNTAKNVLIEDFTGHTCVGCPAAAAEATNIESANPRKGNRCLDSCQHYQWISIPEPAPSVFSADYRTDAGNEYATTFGCDLNPLGMTNRKLGVYPANPNFQPFYQSHPGELAQGLY